MSSTINPLSHVGEESATQSSSDIVHGNSDKNGKITFDTEQVPPEKSAGVTQGPSATYLTAEDVRFYKPIPSYEGAHRWDPYFEWNPKEERRLVRKVLSLIPFLYYLTSNELIARSSDL